MARSTVSTMKLLEADETCFEYLNRRKMQSQFSLRKYKNMERVCKQRLKRVLKTAKQADNMH